jgi:hypothetical protein
LGLTFPFHTGSAAHRSVADLQPSPNLTIEDHRNLLSKTARFSQVSYIAVDNVPNVAASKGSKKNRFPTTAFSDRSPFSETTTIIDSTQNSDKGWITTFYTLRSSGRLGLWDTSLIQTVIRLI